MKRLIRSAFAAFVLLSAACTQDPVPEPPPLFSAFDPTQTCGVSSDGTPQVGWDLSTGGGIEPLQRNSVGDAIKLINANLTGCGLTNMELRAACDGETECARQVTCDDAAVDVTYVCGTETDTYKARVEGTGADRILRVSCGQPIVVLKAIYAPDSPTPADITNALAASCSGKRRCSNGASGYSLNAFQDPAPNQSKVVRVTYRCGVEPSERVTEVDDFKLDFYCAIAATKFAIRERMRIVSALPRQMPSIPDRHADNLAYAAELQKQIATACDGKSECEVTFTGRRANGTTPANWKADRDVSWPLTDMDVDAMGWRHSVRIGTVTGHLGGNYLIVGYTCGIGTVIEYRAVDPQTPAPLNRVNLRCGDRVTITRVETLNPGDFDLATDPVYTQVMKSRCDGRRACTPAGFFGQERSGSGYYTLPDGGIKRMGDRNRYLYTCGDLQNSVSQEITIDNYKPINQYQIECPTAAGDLLETGVRLVSVTPPERTLEVTRLCGGRVSCRAPAGVSATYRCATDPQLKNSTPDMNCSSPIYIQSITRTGGSVYDCWAKPPVDWCGGQTGTCNFRPTYRVENGRFNCGTNTFNYTCGCDTTIRSVTYPPRADGLPAQHSDPAVLTCPSVATSCKRVACVPLTCTGATRRNNDLACVADTTIKPTHQIIAPIVNDWLVLTDGGTHPTGQAIVKPADNTYVYKSDFPYQVFSSVLYKTDDGQALNNKTTAVVWSYDQFEKKAGATRPDGGTLLPAVFGMRCVLGEAAIANGELTSTVPGYRWALMGGKGQTIPRSCYDQDGFNDPSTSFFDAAAASGIPESQFRERYTLSKTWVVSSFDPHGVSTSRRATRTSAALAVNPIGFFYDPKRDYVSTPGYYSQTADFANAIQARFVPSKEIELGALYGDVSYGDLTLDVEDPNRLPSFDVALNWYLRGDSSANPYSARTRVANNPAGTSLADRNLRMTIEMARSDTGLANPWEPSNSVRFPSRALSGGNNFVQADVGRAQITPEIRKRLLTVRTDPNSLAVVTSPDGFMSDMLDEDTTFMVRACVDFDGVTRSPGDTDINDKTLQSLNGYTLKLATRCSPPRTIVFRRQLFVRPVTPALNVELKNDKGGIQPTGDRDVGGSNASAAEVGCVRQCQVNADCGNNGVCNPGAGGQLGTCQKTSDNRQCKDSSRSGGGMAGQFPITMFDARSDSSSESTPMRADSNQTMSCVSARGGGLNFSFINNSPRCENRSDGPVGWNFEMEIAPIWEPIIALFKGKRYGLFSTDATKSIYSRKKLQVRRSRSTKYSPLADGIGLSLGESSSSPLAPSPFSSRSADRSGSA